MNRYEIFFIIVIGIPFLIALVNAFFEHRAGIDTLASYDDYITDPRRYK